MFKLWGLIEYKPQWSLTLSGWLVVFSLFCLSLGILITQIQPFLAYSHAIEAEALILEGWVPDEIVKEAIREFEEGNYQILVTTGLPLPKGHYLSEYKTFAELTAATVLFLGFPADKLVVIPTPHVHLNRTAASAIAVSQWLSDTDLAISRVNIYSFDVHTRRSWLIYRKALGPKVQVGAIAAPSRGYNARAWWTTSMGVRSVISETIAYLYARLCNWQV